VTARRIGILETGRPADALAARHGAYPAMFRALLAGEPDLDLVAYHIEGGEAVPAHDACDGWLITGSRHAVYEDHAWLEPMRVLVREAVDAGIPTVGICFGHQLMAQALGARVERSDRGWGIGLHGYALTDVGRDVWFGETLTLPAMHRDQVLDPPPGAVLLAASPFCPYAGFAFGEAGLSLQAHPEFTEAYQRDLIDARREIIPPDVVTAGLASFETARPDTRPVAHRIAAFLARRD
jgi:GMP synthase-like glutamine amidotransferase